MVHEGDIIQDYTILNKVGRKNNQTLFFVRCNICGNEKVLSSSNIQRQDMSHSVHNCKENYYATYEGISFGDYKIIKTVNIGKEYITTLQCKECGHILRTNLCVIKNKLPQHSYIKCKNDFIANEIGKTYGDYKILSFAYKHNGLIYFNIECSVCHTKGIKSYKSLSKNNFHHGTECFKIMNGKYKKEFSQRFDNMRQRCNNINNTNFLHYGGRGITVSYKYLIDFYIDYIDEFTEYVKTHGIKNSTFDRIDVNKGYEKGNIRVTNQSVQSTNTTKKRFFILNKGNEFVLSDNISEFGRKYNIRAGCIGNVVNGHSHSSHGWKLIAKSKNIEDLKNINVTTKLIVSGDAI